MELLTHFLQPITRWRLVAVMVVYIEAVFKRLCSSLHGLVLRRRFLKKITTTTSSPFRQAAHSCVGKWNSSIVSTITGFRMICANLSLEPFQAE